MQRHTYYQTRQYQKLSVGFDRKKRNRDVRNAFCDIKTGLNMQEMDARNLVSKFKSIPDSFATNWDHPQNYREIMVIPQFNRESHFGVHVVSIGL